MGCFCKSAMGPLQIALPALSAPSLDLSISMPSANIALSLSAWLGARGLPAPPWSPGGLSFDVALPSLSMSAQAMATLSAFANLRAQVMAQFGLDLLVSGQASMFARLAATLSARISASAQLSAGASLGLSVGGGQALLQLAALNFAIDQVNAAIAAGVFAADASASYALPSASIAFLADLSALLPVIAIGMQLDLDLTADFSVDLALAIKAMLAIQMPALPSASLSLMASLSAQLSAVAQLSASLGVNVAGMGLPDIEAMVSVRLSAMMASLSASLDISLSLDMALPNVLALLPSMPACPTLSAPSAVVTAALSLNASAVASLNWQPPALSAVALLQVGLPVVSLSAQLNAALGISAALSPCMGGCDANAVLQAALSI